MPHTHHDYIVLSIVTQNWVKVFVEFELFFRRSYLLTTFLRSFLLASKLKHRVLLLFFVKISDAEFFCQGLLRNNGRRLIVSVF